MHYSRQFRWVKSRSGTAVVFCVLAGSAAVQGCRSSSRGADYWEQNFVSGDMDPAKRDASYDQYVDELLRYEGTSLMNGSTATRLQLNAHLTKVFGAQYEPISVTELSYAGDHRMIAVVQEKPCYNWRYQGILLVHLLDGESPHVINTLNVSWSANVLSVQTVNGRGEIGRVIEIEATTAFPKEYPRTWVFRFAVAHFEQQSGREYSWPRLVLIGHEAVGTGHVDALGPPDEPVIRDVFLTAKEFQRASIDRWRSWLHFEDEAWLLACLHFLSTPYVWDPTRDSPYPSYDPFDHNEEPHDYSGKRSPHFVRELMSEPDIVDRLRDHDNEWIRTLWKKLAPVRLHRDEKGSDSPSQEAQ